MVHSSIHLQILLLSTTHGSTIHGHVIRDMWAEGAQLRQFGMLTHLDSWYRVEFHGAIFFSGYCKCPTDFRDGVVLLHDNVLYKTLP